MEQDRLDIHHEIMLLVAKGQLYKAPVENAQKVLDLGTGTGIWCIDFANDHPEAEVIGLDLRSVHPMQWSLRVTTALPVHDAMRRGGSCFPGADKLIK